MRNFKKLLCIALILSIVMSSFVAYSREYLTPYKFMDDIFKYDLRGSTSDAEVESQTTDPDMNRINLLKTFGIWDDVSKDKDALVTMTEFSVIMSNFKLGYDNALKGVYSHEENLNDAKATYKNAFEYLLESLGYYYRCAEFGNNEEALLIVAADIGLINENPQNINAYITRNDLAKLIIKALNIDICIMEYTGTGGYKYTVAEGNTLLEKIHGVYDISGFVNAIPGLAIYGGTSVREGYIQIDRRNVNASDLDLSEYLGARVQVYATYDEVIDEYSIIYIDYAEDYQVVEIDFSDITSVKQDVVYYIDDEGLEQELTTDTLKYITENGSKLSKIPGDYDYYRTNEGKFVFTSSEKKGELDTAIIYRYNYFVSSYVDTNNLRVGVQFNQEYDGKEYIQIAEKAVNDITLDGSKADYSQIPVGAAFRYFTCADTGYTQIVAYSKKLTGEVISIYGDYINISETEYRKSKDLINIIERGKTDNTLSHSERVNELELGLATTFYVFEDILVGYERTDTYKWGYLRSITKSRTSIDPDLTLKILNENSEWIELKIKDKFELDGQPAVTKDEFLTRVNNNIDIINNIVRYKVGRADEISALDTIEQSRYEAESPDDVEFVHNYNYIRHWTYTWLYNCPYILSDKTIIFVIPAGEEDESKFKVVNNTALPGGNTNNVSSYIPLKLYTPNDIHQISAAVCTKALGDIGTEGGVNRQNAIYVESIRRALLDADNQEYGYRIVGKNLVRGATGILSSLQEITFTISEDMLDTNDVEPGDPEYDPNKVLEVGDIISAGISGGKASQWLMILKEGRVPEFAASTPDPDDVDFKKFGDDQFYGQGIIKKVDSVHRYILLDVDGSIYPIATNYAAFVDPENRKIQLNSMSNLAEGDKVYLCWFADRAVHVIKNGDL